MTYTLAINGVIRDSDNKFIPLNPNDSDWQEYQQWLIKGNYPNPAPPPLPPPQIVPMWAVRTVLQNDKLFDQAQAAITASTDNALKNVWEYGNFADRNSKAIASLAVTLNLTDAQVDQMFIDANSLEV